jgi:hypothetical protein
LERRLRFKDDMAGSEQIRRAELITLTRQTDVEKRYL